MTIPRLTLTLLAALAASCAAPPVPPRAGASAGASAGVSAGAPVDLTLRALGGEALSFESLRGRVVVVDAWASWCGPCIRALPSMEKLARVQPEDIVVIGLSVDHDRKALTNFLNERPLPYFIAHADADASRTFRAPALPTVFVLDRKGVIRETLVGTHSDAVLLETARRYL